jgi:hypothetical protein
MAHDTGGVSSDEGPTLWVVWESGILSFVESNESNHLLTNQAALCYFLFLADFEHHVDMLQPSPSYSRGLNKYSSVAGGQLACFSHLHHIRGD